MKYEWSEQKHERHTFTCAACAAGLCAQMCLLSNRLNTTIACVTSTIAMLATPTSARLGLTAPAAAAAAEVRALAPQTRRGGLYGGQQGRACAQQL